MKEKIEKIQLYTPPPTDNINLAMNENHHINWSDILSEHLQEIHDDYDYSLYGKVEFTELVNSYATYVGLQPENILIVSGSESVISLLYTAFVKKTVMLFEPDFFRFRELAEQMDITVVSQNLLPAFDVEATLAKINAENVELCLFSNPNNPLGAAISRADIIRLLEETNCYLVVDEAYMEFAGESVVDLVPHYKKLLIMRTMSKGWGLPALRVGYTIAQAEVITYLMKALGPFNMSSFVTKIAAHAMDHPEEMKKNVAAIIALRDEWVTKFQVKYGWKVYPTQANFINVETEDAFAIWAFLKERKLNVSKFPPHNLRISIGNELEMATLEALLDEYVAAER